ncbi:MAG: serine/threonine protein kinase [Muribaculaceae bacterium]
MHNYVVRRVLGQGGFGITYLVDTPIKVGNISVTVPFVIKEHFIATMCERDPNSQQVRYSSPVRATMEAMRRAFVNESTRLQKLGITHDNIVKVNEVFEANNSAYYVMEYLQGCNLEEYVRKNGSLTMAQTAAIMKPICDAVALLHQNKVTHYDIKPANIMMVGEGDEMRPVLIDFGLAKHYDSEGNATSTVGGAAYSLGYSPVEQYRGLSSFQPTADVYSLAATICFCLTGKRPANAEDLDLDTYSETLLNYASDEQVYVLTKAMEYRPAKRWRDASALVDALFGHADADAVSEESMPTQLLAVEVNDEQPASTVPMFAVNRQPQPVAEPPSQQQPSTSSQNGYRTYPRNLDLKVVIDGRGYYFSEEEWLQLADYSRSIMVKVGVVIDHNDCPPFLAALRYDRTAMLYTWREAMALIGKFLPSKEQAEAMATQAKAFCHALKTFGGDEEARYSYWTTTSDALTPRFWTYHLFDGILSLCTPEAKCHARAIYRL